MRRGTNEGDRFHIRVETGGVISPLQHGRGDNRGKTDETSQTKVGTLQNDDTTHSEGQNQPNRRLGQDILENGQGKKCRLFNDDGDDDSHQYDIDSVVYQEFLPLFARLGKKPFAGF